MLTNTKYSQQPEDERSRQTCALLPPVSIPTFTGLTVGGDHPDGNSECVNMCRYSQQPEEEEQEPGRSRQDCLVPPEDVAGISAFLKLFSQVSAFWCCCQVDTPCMTSPPSSSFFLMSVPPGAAIK